MQLINLGYDTPPMSKIIGKALYAIQLFRLVYLFQQIANSRIHALFPHKMNNSSCLTDALFKTYFFCQLNLQQKYGTTSSVKENTIKALNLYIFFILYIIIRYTTFKSIQPFFVAFLREAFLVPCTWILKLTPLHTFSFSAQGCTRMHAKNGIVKSLPIKHGRISKLISQLHILS